MAHIGRSVNTEELNSLIDFARSSQDYRETINTLLSKMSEVVAQKTYEASALGLTIEIGDPENTRSIATIRTVHGEARARIQWNFEEKSDIECAIVFDRAVYDNRDQKSWEEVWSLEVKSNGLIRSANENGISFFPGDRQFGVRSAWLVAQSVAYVIVHGPQF